MGCGTSAVIDEAGRSRAPGLNPDLHVSRVEVGGRKLRRKGRDRADDDPLRNALPIIAEPVVRRAGRTGGRQDGAAEREATRKGRPAPPAEHRDSSHSVTISEQGFTPDRMLSIAVPANEDLGELQQIVQEWLAGLRDPDSEGDPWKLGDAQACTLDSNAGKMQDLTSSLSSEGTLPETDSGESSSLGGSKRSGGLPSLVVQSREEWIKTKSFRREQSRRLTQQDGGGSSGEEGRVMTAENLSMLPGRKTGYHAESSVGAEDGEWMYQLRKLEQEHEKRMEQRQAGGRKRSNAGQRRKSRRTSKLVESERQS